MTTLLQDEIENALADVGNRQQRADAVARARRETRPFNVEDRAWRSYVARLAPTDESAAFLLPDELPAVQSSPREIRYALATATRRALGRHRRVQITDHTPGRIRGIMRVLLPQGREIVYRFENELGWRATVSYATEAEERSFVAYYRYACMNPARFVTHLGGELDTAQVTFAPLDKTAVALIENSPVVNGLIDVRLPRLRREYVSLVRARRLGEESG